MLEDLSEMIGERVLPEVHPSRREPDARHDVQDAKLEAGMSAQNAKINALDQQMLVPLVMVTVRFALLGVLTTVGLVHWFSSGRPLAPPASVKVQASTEERAETGESEAALGGPPPASSAAGVDAVRSRGDTAEESQPAQSPGH